ncbi:MAG: PDZ domain-containing protein [Rhodocyclaceae bacterium]|nr:PDZ domain-containing protein [Rhodocyclaceae bacterium]
MTRLLRRLFAGLLAGFFLLPAVASNTSAARPVAPRGPLAADELATVDIFRKASPSVVFITTLDRVVNLWTMNVREVPKGTGSGFVWEEQGGHLLIVTNYHVVVGARIAQVRLSDQRTFPAELVGVSPDHDLAVLRIKVPERRPAALPLGSSRDLLVGQRVLAIGNPFGLDHTLTTGIISALDRSIDGEEGPIHRLIQTDAAINPGNSGGPLLDSAGRLIGVNTAIYSPSGASAGIGFAVPADTVNRVVPELIAFGRYRRPTMGITSIDRVGAVITQRLGIKGALVLDVESGSAASQAGLRPSRVNRDGSVVPGDVIQSIDGQPVDGAAGLDRLLDGRSIGDRLTLGLWREGKTLTVSLTLGAPKR